MLKRSDAEEKKRKTINLEEYDWKINDRKNNAEGCDWMGLEEKDRKMKMEKKWLVEKWRGLQQFEEEAGPAEAEHVAGDVVPDADVVPEADELNVNSQIDELPPILTDVTWGKRRDAE